MKSKVIFSRQDIDMFEENKPIKLKRGEKFVSFIKFKRKLFVITTKSIFELIEKRLERVNEIPFNNPTMPPPNGE